MNFLFYLLIGSCVVIENYSCQCKAPIFVHLSFCDAINNVGVDSGKKLQEKSITYLVDETDTKCLPDSMFRKFIMKDSFVNSEINKGYYSLTLTFYKKSKFTQSVLESGSSRNLVYCNNDIVVDYEWINGVQKGAYFYKDGKISGSDNIKLLDGK